LGKRVRICRRWFVDKLITECNLRVADILLSNFGANSMRRCFAVLLLTPGLILAQPPAAQPIPAPKAAPQGKLVRDDWETAYIDGYRVGFTHLTVHEFVAPDGSKILRAARDLQMTVRRGPDLARITAITGTDERPDGTVLGIFMRQTLAANVNLDVQGIVKGNKIQIKSAGDATYNKTEPWSPKAVGTLGELRILTDKKPKPGDQFDYEIYEPIVNHMVTVRVRAEGFENVPIGKTQMKLLRLVAKPDKIDNVQLPSQILWIDDAFEVRRSRTAMPGMGYLVVDRSTEADANRQIDVSQLPDLMERQSIKVKQHIGAVHNRSSIVYRITMPNDEEPEKTFAADKRQAIGNVQGKTFDLTVRALRQPPTVVEAGAVVPGKECTESNFFLTSDDPLVKQHAANAVGFEADPWRKALMIERWVRQNMREQNFSIAMAPASEVAKTLSGDCTEYSMLAAAMCKAVGLPARTAIGLVYVDRQPPSEPILGFHMWTEVFVRGQWMAIDATLGQGGVGPAHVKITDADWHNTRSMTPLMPLMRVMIGGASADVVQVK
jgi:hypothetical protein